MHWVALVTACKIPMFRCFCTTKAALGLIRMLSCGNLDFASRQVGEAPTGLADRVAWLELPGHRNRLQFCFYRSRMVDVLVLLGNVPRCLQLRHDHERVSVLACCSWLQPFGSNAYAKAMFFSCVPRPAIRLLDPYCPLSTRRMRSGQPVDTSQSDESFFLGA